MFWRTVTVVGFGILAVTAGWLFSGHAVAQKADGKAPSGWVDEIEKIFIRSEDCKQCHDRHYEEWKGVREQTPDLKTFGRIDAALLHGTSLESPIFRAVLGVWLQTNPTPDQKRQCLSCHVPSTTVFPQHVEKIASQVLAGKVEVEGISCASCHLINDTAKDPAAPAPTFKLNPGKTLYGPYADPEENLVHPAAQSDLYRNVSYCASCHFDKVKDVTTRQLPGEILQGTVCQDCHMEPSTGSSTSKRGAMTRAIGRHWFRGVVIPGVMLKNRNLQAEFIQELRCCTRPQRILSLRVWRRDEEFDPLRFCVDHQHMRDHGARDPLNDAAICHAFMEFLFHRDGRGPAAVIEEIAYNA